MVIIKLPNEYFNIYDTIGDKECNKTRTFMKEKVQVDGGYIDDVGLAILISGTNELIDNANSLKSLANNQSEVMLLNSIAEMLHNEQKKMIIMQKCIEKIEETRRTL